MEWSFKALGTTWWIEIFSNLSKAKQDEAKEFVLSFVTAYENNYSRFHPDSQVSVLNRDRRLPHPSKEFIAILEYGKQLYLRSDTYFNFLTGHILEARGYDAAYSFKDKQSNEIAGNPINDLKITPDTVTLTHGNLDLGGFGKGYLIDLLATEFCRRFDLRQFLINGGGDMYATNQAGEPIIIQLEHPTKPGTMIGSTTLFNSGFAASSPHRRVWQNTNGTHHHIIAKQITADATFIKATTATDADAFATTSLMMNQQQLETLAKTEKLAVALFDLKTETLLTTEGF